MHYFIIYLEKKKQKKIISKALWIKKKKKKKWDENNSRSDRFDVWIALLNIMYYTCIFIKQQNKHNMAQSATLHIKRTTKSWSTFFYQI